LADKAVGNGDRMLSTVWTSYGSQILTGVLASLVAALVLWRLSRLTNTPKLVVAGRSSSYYSGNPLSHVSTVDIHNHNKLFGFWVVREAAEITGASLRRKEYGDVFSVSGWRLNGAPTNKPVIESGEIAQITLIYRVAFSDECFVVYGFNDDKTLKLSRMPIRDRQCELLLTLVDKKQRTYNYPFTMTIKEQGVVFMRRTRRQKLKAGLREIASAFKP
jgi:hypothetical protein